ncbi:unnamed protein product [Paramecium pentaurelia]|uniref:Casein kinase I n=1 Tax=Paramecium pentaurelia TaxID=43138 RepID=A0A8S1WB46_9CILI|nr:unnamed protein product [Paramecium pentaurelia]
MQKIGQNFELKKKLGSGAFGDIYLGVNTKNNIEVAIKLEPISSQCPQLRYEHEIYKRLLADNQSIDRGIPHVYYTSEEGGYTFMVMDLLGASLEEIFVSKKKKFSLKTVVMIGLQFLERIEFIHSKGIIHRDIKPDNFLIGKVNKQNKIYILDFGLAKRFIKENGHIPYRESKTLTGTARYCSLNTHLGVEQSRRDDIECMAYVLFYFLKSTLPWQNMRAKNKREKYERIMEKKMTTTYDELCKGVPKEFGLILKHARNLEFEEEPNYKYLKGLLENICQQERITVDNQFDWCK